MSSIEHRTIKNQKLFFPNQQIYLLTNQPKLPSALIILPKFVNLA